MKRDLISSKPSFMIVGAGPAGLVLGILLIRKGYPTAILERETHPHRQVCGEYLSPQGVAYLQALGLEQTVGGFRRLWGMKMGSPGAVSVLAQFPENKYGLAINRQELLARLQAEFRSLGGLLFCGETLTSVEQIGNHLRIESNKNEYICDALIGADGRSSQVAKLAGLERLPSPRPRVAIHAYLKPKIPFSPFGQMHILGGGSYAGINPISPEEVNFSIVADASLLKDWGGAKNLVNHFLSSHPSLSRHFSPIEDEAVKTTFPIDCHRREIVKGRVALIGDASGFIDPLTGEGITTAIKTASLLFEKIQAEASIEEGLAAYSRARRRDYRQKETLNHVLQKVIRRPLLCELVAHGLRAFPRIRALFIGVIGNIYTPAQAAGRFFLGGKHGQNRSGTNRIPSAPALSTRSDPTAENRLA